MLTVNVKTETMRDSIFMRDWQAYLARCSQVGGGVKALSSSEISPSSISVGWRSLSIVPGLELVWERGSPATCPHTCKISSILQRSQSLSCSSRSTLLTLAVYDSQRVCLS